MGDLIRPADQLGTEREVTEKEEEAVLPEQKWVKSLGFQLTISGETERVG